MIASAEGRPPPPVRGALRAWPDEESPDVVRHRRKGAAMKLSIIRKLGSRSGLGVAFVAIALVGLVGSASLMRAAPPRTPAYLRNFPNFAPVPTPQLPGDVDIALKTRLEAAKKFSQVQ